MVARAPGAVSPTNCDCAGCLPLKMISLVRVGGLICFTARVDFLDDPHAGFGQGLEALERTGTIEQLWATPPEVYTPNVSSEILYRCLVYRVCASGMRGMWVTCS